MSSTHTSRGASAHISRCILTPLVRDAYSHHTRPSHAASFCLPACTTHMRRVLQRLLRRGPVTTPVHRLCRARARQRHRSLPPSQLPPLTARPLRQRPAMRRSRLRPSRLRRCQAQGRTAERVAVAWSRSMWSQPLSLVRTLTQMLQPVPPWTGGGRVAEAARAAGLRTGVTRCTAAVPAAVMCLLPCCACCRAAPAAVPAAVLCLLLFCRSHGHHSGMAPLLVSLERRGPAAKSPPCGCCKYDLPQSPSHLRLYRTRSQGFGTRRAQPAASFWEHPFRGIHTAASLR